MFLNLEEGIAEEFASVQRFNLDVAYRIILRKGRAARMSLEERQVRKKLSEKKWLAANVERVKKRRRDYYQAHREHILAWKKAWNIKQKALGKKKTYNKEERAIYLAAYYVQNRAKVNATKRAYVQKKVLVKRKAALLKGERPTKGWRGTWLLAAKELGMEI